MKIYIVTSGSYSDYSIQAVFTIKEKAEEYVTNWNRASHYDDAEIEEWDSDESIDLVFAVDVEMDKEGNTDRTELVFNPSLDSIGFLYWHEPSRWHPKESFTWRVATDEIERAVKVVNEKRTWILTNDLWGKEKEIQERLKGVTE